MLLERRLVSRKTPFNGRLEITAESAALGSEFAVASAALPDRLILPQHRS